MYGIVGRSRGLCLEEYRDDVGVEFRRITHNRVGRAFVEARTGYHKVFVPLGALIMYRIMNLWWRYWRQ